jgi:predicted nucleic acid-binding protein
MAMEVVSALRRLVARGVIPTARAQGAIEDLAAMNLELWPTVPLLERTWQLRDNITPFDAAYVALAELLDAVLVTADGPLARAIPQMSTVRVRLVA